jgi:hypothetical protein
MAQKKVIPGVVKSACRRAAEITEIAKRIKLRFPWSGIGSLQAQRSVRQKGELNSIHQGIPTLKAMT